MQRAGKSSSCRWLILLVNVLLKALVDASLLTKGGGCNCLSPLLFIYFSTVGITLLTTCCYEFLLFKLFTLFTH